MEQRAAKTGRRRGKDLEAPVGMDRPPAGTPSADAAPGHGTAARLLLDQLHAWGIRTIFSVPGAHIDFLMECATLDGRFQVVIASHEQGAAYMADGLARFVQGPAVVISLGGPGVTNIVTAAVTARMDHVPLLLVSGDVPTRVTGAGGFQSSESAASNVCSIMREAAGCSVRAESPDAVPRALAEVEGRLLGPATLPAHMEFPLDVSRGLAPHSDIRPVRDTGEPQLTGLIPALKPGALSAVYVGGEIRRRTDLERLANVCTRHALPVAWALDAMAIQELIAPELQLGVFGYGGGPRAHAALLDPQLESLFAVGVALNERNTLLWNDALFHPARQIVRLSAWPDAMCLGPRPITEVLASSPVTTLEAILDRHGPDAGAAARRADWCRMLMQRPLRAQPAPALVEPGRMSLHDMLLTMRQSMPDDADIFVDSGAHRLYAGMFWECRAGRFLTAAQTAPMGWAVAAAVGASFAPDAGRLWVLTGDGCMLMHGMEIAVAARYRRKVVFLVSNNGYHSKVAQRLRDKPPALISTLTALPDVSWASLARALGVPASTVSTPEELSRAIGTACTQPGPYLVEVMTHGVETCPWPPADFSSAQANFDPASVLPGY